MTIAEYINDTIKNPALSIVIDKNDSGTYPYYIIYDQDRFIGSLRLIFRLVRKENEVTDYFSQYIGKVDEFDWENIDRIVKHDHRRS